MGRINQRFKDRTQNHEIEFGPNIYFPSDINNFSKIIFDFYKYLL